MGGKMSKNELRKRGARIHPEDDALEEPLLEDYVHVTAPEVENAVPAAAPPGQDVPPSSSRQATAEQAPVVVATCQSSLQHQLSVIWKSLVMASLRAWAYIRGAVMWALTSLRLLPSPPPRLSLVQQERLQELQERLAVPYSAESPTHQAALRALWEIAFPATDFPPAIKSERWKEMGWQSDDPGRDFRGAGFISLESLLHMAQREEGTFFQLMSKEDGTRSEWEYPFAAAGVNLTYMLSEVLDLRDSGRIPSSAAGRAFLPLLAQSDTAFEELFVVSYRLLDKTWLRMGASYMEFPRVIKAVRRRVERALGSGVGSMEELQQILLKS